MFSFMYLVALLMYILLQPIYFLSTGSRELLYKMTTRFDHRPLPIYLLCLGSNMWVGIIVASLMFGEANVISTLIFHLNGRFIIMKEKLVKRTDYILQHQGNGELIAKDFQRILVETLKENMRLNVFAQQIQDEFSFRLFVILSFMAASICALGFKVYTVSLNGTEYFFNILFIANKFS